MQLYSIEFDQLTLSSEADAAGNMVSSETRTRKRISDLPLQTMAMYREKMTGLNFVSEAQTEVSNDPVKRERRTYSHNGAAKAPPVGTTLVKSHQEKINDAAASGDLTAAINMGVL
jgi:hypothetical protein